jgi:hypothetical protein
MLLVATVVAHRFTPTWTKSQQDMLALNDLEALLTVACEAKEWMAAHALKR